MSELARKYGRWAALLLCAWALLAPAPALGQACTQAWSLGQDAPQAFYRGAAAYRNGKVYIAGGALDSGGFLHRVWIYDIAGDSWSLGAPYDLQGWMNACLVAHNNKLYMFGGWIDSATFLKLTRIYDIAGNSWSWGADVPFVTSGPYCAELDGMIHVAGGSSSAYVMHAEHAAYRPLLNSWITNVADLPTVRAYGLAGADDEHMYVFGSNLDDKAYAFDPDLNAWSALPDMRQARMSPGGGYAGGTLFAAVGGDVDNGVPDWWDPLSNAEYYLIGQDAWRSLSPPPVKVTAPASVIVPGNGGLLLLFGGTQIDVERAETQILTLCIAELEDVTPTLIANGAETELSINGQGFQPLDTAYLLSGEHREDLGSLSVHSDQSIGGLVPAFAQAGVYDLVLQSISGESAVLPGALTICNCYIDGVCYFTNETAPDNDCLICDPYRAGLAWSFNDGQGCDDGLFCNGADLCLSGACAAHAGDPCAAGLQCDEQADDCLSADDDTDADDDADNDSDDDSLASDLTGGCGC